ncbi:MAG: hypothetical protein K2G75_04060 [Muribaculaceae bacterium]|nr:hypothetical protein [Muribaculaceae bacterium]
MGKSGKIEIRVIDKIGNEQYLAGLIKKASPKWRNIGDADEWLSEIRGVSE